MGKLFNIILIRNHRTICQETAEMYLQWSSTRFFFIDLSEIQEGHDWQENEKIIIFFLKL
jgi:hypothetical protein